MASTTSNLSTGLPGLDRMLRGLLPGDNVVWLVESIEDYRPFVQPYCDYAQRVGLRPIYFRFAKHPPLLPDNDLVQTVELQPERGFEWFIKQTHTIVQEHAPGGIYVFDNLSELAVDWFSDQMLANFFMLTCPYLYDVQALAYFALLRNYHSPNATEPIGDTAQVLIDVFNQRGKLFVQPVKVAQRHSSTMYTLHAWEGDEFRPVTESAANAEILAPRIRDGLDAGARRPGVFQRAFRDADGILRSVQRGSLSSRRADERAHQLLRRIIAGEDRLQKLCREYMTLDDVLTIQKRMIGTGQIGGKAAGMLLARAILKKKSPRWANLLEAQDSFFIGSHVFTSFLVRNGCWWERQKLASARSWLHDAGNVRQLMQTGGFMEHIKKQFSDMLDYFGQSPIIVRSSSLLEDSFGHSFTGKYQSIFCANQGSPRTRLENFINAVRTVYTSCMSETALAYRAHRGLLEQDEQMALLVQRVSGSTYGSYFYPQLAGVGFSYNPYVWSKDIDPSAGVLRLVFGMGTRAVDRSDDDYTRVAALNAPQKRPEATFDEVRKYAQRKVDVLDLEANLLVTEDIANVVRRSGPNALPLELFASRDEAAERWAAESGNTDSWPWALTFDRLVSDTEFMDDAREMLAILEDAYEHPVDIEFTCNFFNRGGYKINLVQCRPFLVRKDQPILQLDAAKVPEEDVILRARGAVIGPGRTLDIDQLVCVMPNIYGQLSLSDRHNVARLIGQITKTDQNRKKQRTIMLLGPGRWGTTTPWLGVPVRFAEVSTISVLCEIVSMSENIVPDVSLGAHFFNELVEMDILYLALFPEREDNHLNLKFLENAPNRLLQILPQAGRMEHVIKVIDSRDMGIRRGIKLYANALDQMVLCHVSDLNAVAEAEVEAP